MLGCCPTSITINSTKMRPREKTVNADRNQPSGEYHRSSCRLPQNPHIIVATLMLLSASQCAAMVLERSVAPSLVKIAQEIRRQRLRSNAVDESTSGTVRARLLRGRADNGASRDLYADLYSAAITSSSNPSRTRRSWTEELFDEAEDEAALLDDTTDIRVRVRVEASAVAGLRTATGTDVPDMELYLQMEAARKRAGSSAAAASAFINGHVANATSIEKLAMSSMPLQLPGPAASVLGDSTKVLKSKMKAASKTCDEVTKTQAVARSKRTKSIAQNRGMEIPKKSTKVLSSVTSAKKSSSLRVSHEEEIELAHIIQRGSTLHKIKTKFEEKHGRDISRQEWADIAELESPRELRRLVSSYRQAKTKLVTANMGLLYAVVKSQYGAWCRQKGISEEELVQEGSLGLIRAAELFDPSRGLRFSTYATIWIKGVLSNNKLDETISLPARDKSKWNKIYKASADLAIEQGNGRDSYKPNTKDVASRVGMKVKDVEALTNRMSKAQNLLSLDYKYQATSRSGSDSGEADFHNYRSLHADADLVERLQLRADVIAALARNLDPREARLMRLRYGLKDGVSRSLVQCADAMGISREKTRRLALKCLEKLREADDANSLQEYLLTVA